MYVAKITQNASPLIRSLTRGFVCVSEIMETPNLALAFFVSTLARLNLISGTFVPARRSKILIVNKDSPIPSKVSHQSNMLSVQEMNMLESQNELSHSMLIRHHECTQDLEFRHLNAVHRLRRDQQQNQHQTEYTSQVDYNKRLEFELRKKHLFELKMQPKTLKVK